MMAKKTDCGCGCVPPGKTAKPKVKIEKAKKPKKKEQAFRFADDRCGGNPRISAGAPSAPPYNRPQRSKRQQTFRQARHPVPV